MSTKVKNFFAGILSIAFALVFFVNSLSIRSIGYSKISASFFPQVISILLFILGASLIIPSLKETINWVKTIDFHISKKTLNISEFLFTHKLFFSILFVSLYCIGIEKIGFLSSSILYLFLQILLLSNKLNKKNVLTTLLVSILVSGIVFAVFRYGFKISLPSGILM